MRGLGFGHTSASGGFSPKRISGLIAWYDGRKGVYSDTGLTTPANDGDPVAGWADQSGNGYHLTQATAGARPTYSVTAFNGHPGLNFAAASSQKLANAAVPFGGVSAATAFVVFASNSNTTLAQFGPSTSGFSLNWTGSNLLTSTFPPDAEYGQTANVVQVPQLYAARFDMAQTGSANRLKHWVGGNPAAVTFPGQPIGNPSGAGAGVVVGSAGTIQYLNGPLLELVVYNRALTDAEVARVNAYLGAKWFTGLARSVICGGDSLTVGYPASSLSQPTYPSTLGTLLGSGWSVTSGAAAETGANLARIEQLAGVNVDRVRQTYRPEDWYFLWGGINDLQAGTAPATVFSSLLSVAQNRANKGFKVGTMTATSRTDSPPAGFEANRLALNTMIRTQANPPWQFVADVGASPAAFWGANNTAPYSNNDGVHLSTTGYQAVAAYVNNTFAAYRNNAPSITLLTPAGGTSLAHGSAYTISYEAYGVPCVVAVDIHYSIDGGATWVAIATNQAVDAWTYAWTVPNAPSTNCKVRVRDANNPANTGVSGTFMIV